MKDWNRWALILMLAILVVVPLLAEVYLVGRGSDAYHSALEQTRQTGLEQTRMTELEQARQSELQRKEGHELDRKRLRDALFAWYECDPRTTCRSVDFNKDGIPESLTVEKLPGLDEMWLTVTAAKDKRLLLWLPFNDDAGDLRTRVAVIEQTGESHLMVYDQVSYAQPLEIVYRYDGYLMLDVSGAQFETAMSSGLALSENFTIGHGEIDDGNGGVFLKLFCYYFVLTVLVAVVVYKRRDDANGGNAYLSLRGHP